MSPEISFKRQEPLLYLDVRGSTNAPRGGETANMDGMRHRQRRNAAGESRRQQRLPVPSIVLMARRGGPTGV